MRRREVIAALGAAAWPLAELSDGETVGRWVAEKSLTHPLRITRPWLVSARRGRGAIGAAVGARRRPCDLGFQSSRSTRA